MQHLECVQGSVVSGCACEGATITRFFFNVADDSALGALTDRKDVAGSEGCFFAAVDECTGVKAFSCNECLRMKFVVVGIMEDDTCEGCATEKQDFIK